MLIYINVDSVNLPFCNVKRAGTKGCGGANTTWCGWCNAGTILFPNSPRWGTELNASPFQMEGSVALATAGIDDCRSLGATSIACCHPLLPRRRTSPILRFPRHSLNRPSHNNAPHAGSTDFTADASLQISRPPKRRSTLHPAKVLPLPAAPSWIQVRRRSSLARRGL